MASEAAYPICVVCYQLQEEDGGAAAAGSSGDLGSPAGAGLARRAARAEEAKALANMDALELHVETCDG